MEKKYVLYNGVEVLEGWAEEIQEAQHVTYSIGGKQVERIRYGNEKDDRGAKKHFCRDCAVALGQFHVPGCDIEQCPVCGGQAITCNCPFDEEPVVNGRAQHQEVDSSSAVG